MNLPWRFDTELYFDLPIHTVRTSESKFNQIICQTTNKAIAELIVNAVNNYKEIEIKEETKQERIITL